MFGPPKNRKVNRRTDGESWFKVQGPLLARLGLSAYVAEVNSPDQPAVDG